MVTRNQKEHENIFYSLAILEQHSGKHLQHTYILYITSASKSDSDSYDGVTQHTSIDYNIEVSF